VSYPQTENSSERTQVCSFTSLNPTKLIIKCEQPFIWETAQVRADLSNESSLFSHETPGQMARWLLSPPLTFDPKITAWFANKRIIKTEAIPVALVSERAYRICRICLQLVSWGEKPWAVPPVPDHRLCDLSLTKQRGTLRVIRKQLSEITVVSQWPRVTVPHLPLHISYLVTWRHLPHISEIPGALAVFNELEKWNNCLVASPR